MGRSTIRTFALLTLVVGASSVEGQSRTARARQALGEALFRETELSNQGMDFSRSCGGCHFRGEDPRGAGARFFAEAAQLSLLPAVQSQDPRTTLRNTPMILDLDLMESYGHDGRWSSLEDLVLDKLTSEQFGWRPEDRERALDGIQQTLLGGQLVDYRELFLRAYRVELEGMSREEVVAQAVGALVFYIDEIVSGETALWDAFAEMNRIPLGPSRDETPKHYAGRVHGRIGNQEGRVLIKRPIGFSQEAYEGFKIFFRVDGEASVGNCVSCHVPPRFSDFSFHSTGQTQADYDQANGDGAFSDLEVPGPEAERPVADLLSDPRSGEGHADLGHWNWIDTDDEAELEAAVGAFKTPVLRNLGQTSPYMHNGVHATIEDVVREIVRVNRLARAGKLRGIDEDYRIMNLSEADVGPLAAFLGTLDEVPVDDFRQLLIDFEE